MIITPEEIGTLARPCFADDTIAERIIAEAEREDIRPRLGDALYLRVMEGGDPALDVLLEGGEWRDAQDRRRLLTGLKTTLAYFAYARIVRDGNIQSTRYGAVIKTDENSDESEKSERMRHYRETFAVADRLLKEVLEYVAANRSIFPEFQCQGTGMTNNRTRMTIVGQPRRSTAPSRTPSTGAALPTDVVRYSAQTVTGEQRTQARRNIGILEMTAEEYKNLPAKDQATLYIIVNKDEAE